MAIYYDKDQGAFGIDGLGIVGRTEVVDVIKQVYKDLPLTDANPFATLIIQGLMFDLESGSAMWQQKDYQRDEIVNQVDKIIKAIRPQEDAYSLAVPKVALYNQFGEVFPQLGSKIYSIVNADDNCVFLVSSSKNSLSVQTAGIAGIHSLNHPLLANVSEEVIMRLAIYCIDFARTQFTEEGSILIDGEELSEIQYLTVPSEGLKLSLDALRGN